MNSTGPSKKVHIKRNFTLTVARCMGVIIPGDFKVVHIKRHFALNVFVLTRFHCSIKRPFTRSAAFGSRTSLACRSARACLLPSVYAHVSHFSFPPFLFIILQYIIFCRWFVSPLPPATFADCHDVKLAHNAVSSTIFRCSKYNNTFGDC